MRNHFLVGPLTHHQRGRYFFRLGGRTLQVVRRPAPMAEQPQNITELGRLIDDACERAGVKQAQLAKAIGVTQRTLGNWKAGKTSPNLEQIRLMADRLGILPDYFFDGTEQVLVPRAVRREVRQHAVAILRLIRRRSKRDRKD